MDQTLLTLTLTLLISIAGVWIGSGVVLKNALKLARKLKIPSFILSFVLIGFLTSSTEIAVAFSSFFNKEPEVSAGNLLGGIIVLFLFLIPLLSLVFNGIILAHAFNKFVFLLNILVLMLPALLFQNGVLSATESLLLLLAGLLVYLAIIIHNREKYKPEAFCREQVISSGKPVFKILLGMVVLVLAANFLVEGVVNLAHTLQVAPFVISLIGLALGTNLPEITLAVKAALMRQKEMALGNYMGSASFNVLILGVLGLANGGITVSSNFTSTILITLAGLFLFWLFMLSKHKLSRPEGALLLIAYLIFLLLEIF